MLHKCEIGFVRLNRCFLLYEQIKRLVIVRNKQPQFFRNLARLKRQNKGVPAVMRRHGRTYLAAHLNTVCQQGDGAEEIMAVVQDDAVSRVIHHHVQSRQFGRNRGLGVQQIQAVGVVARFDYRACQHLRSEVHKAGIAAANRVTVRYQCAMPCRIAQVVPAFYAYHTVIVFQTKLYQIMLYPLVQIFEVHVTETVETVRLRGNAFYIHRYHDSIGFLACPFGDDECLFQCLYSSGRPLAAIVLRPSVYHAKKVQAHCIVRRLVDKSKRRTQAVTVQRIVA